MGSIEPARSQVFCIQDLKEAASERMTKMNRDYYNGGAMDNLTLAQNEAAFDRYLLRPRVLRDVSDVDTSVTVWGSKVAFPLGFSPSAMHRIAHPDGEVGTSKACAARRVPLCLSALSNDSIEDVIAQSSDGATPYAIQVSPFNDRDLTLGIVSRAQAAGYKAVVMTVDAPVFGRRLNDLRNGFKTPAGLAYPNLKSLAPSTGANKLGVGIPDLSFDPSANWENTIGWLRSHTSMEVWVKGVTSPDDIALAVEHGVDGVIISNHGGRQLDTVPATIDILRECAPLAKGKIRLAIDGGIRRGSDIFKAIALGADFVLVGRIAIWGLAYDGHNGVGLAIDMLMNEFKLCMQLTGCKTVADISLAHLSVLQSNGVLEQLR